MGRKEMGKRRGNPKALRAILQRKKASFNASLMSMFHGNPRGYNGGVFLTADGRAIDVRSIPDAVTEGRKKALVEKLRLEGMSVEINEACYIKVVGQHYPYGLKRFFSGEKHFFREEMFAYTRTSIVYSNKHLAMFAFNTGRITWIECIPSSRSAPPVDSG